MFKVEIEWDKAHKDTQCIVIENGRVLELDKDANWLRSHSVQSMVGSLQVDKPTAVAPAQDGGATSFLPTPPAVPVKLEPIKVNAGKWAQLLAQLKSQAVEKTTHPNAHLTIMEIHERLLAAVEHD